MAHNLPAATEAARRRLAVLAHENLTDADDARMDGARDAVDLLHVELREHVLLVDRGILKIALRRGVDDVAHVEALDRLILRDDTVAIRAVDARRVAAAVLGAAVVAALRRHGSKG